LKRSVSNVRAFVTLLSGLGFMSFAAIFLKSAHAPGIVTAFYRMAIATCILILPFVLSLTKAENRIFPLRGVLLAVLAGCCFASDMCLWGTGVVLSNATIPTLTANLAPVWVGFGSMILFRQKLKKGFWAGVLLAIAGMFFLIQNHWNGHSNLALGAILGAGAGIFYGIFYLASEPGRKLLSTLQFLFIFTATAAVFLAIAMLVIGYNFTGYDRHSYLMFFGIGACVQVCGWFLINYAQGFLPASTVAPTLLGQPVLTFIWAAILLNERLSVWHITGGVIIIAGIYLVHYSQSR
jgi:drug/metabolite transporter (DMT)-like permease